MARSNLIKDFINSNMNIDTALQNLISILYCLDDQVSISWANKELSGYDSDDELPKYRKLKGRVMASFFIEYCEYSKRQFGIEHLEEDFRNKLLSVNIYSSISTIGDIKDKEGATLVKSIPPELYALLQSASNAHITDATVDIDSGKINDIISKVRAKILKTLLFLEKEFGNLDDLDIDVSTKSPKELKNIVQHIQVTLYDNSVNIGDNNKIKKSNITTNK